MKKSRAERAMSIFKPNRAAKEVRYTRRYDNRIVDAQKVKLATLLLYGSEHGVYGQPQLMQYKDVAIALGCSTYKLTAALKKKAHNGDIVIQDCKGKEVTADNANA